MRRAIAILRLCRIEYSGFGYVALVGACAEVGSAVPVPTLIALIACNVFFGAWTFAHNDLCDLEIDRRSPGLDERVLVRGDLSPRDAKLVIAVLMGAMFVLAAWRLGGAAALAFAVASAFAIVYDLISKRVVGSDVLFGISAACLALAGAWSVRGLGIPGDVACLVIAITGVEYLFFNAIEGGLKDVVSDREAGARTFAQRFIAFGGRGEPGGDADAIVIGGVFRFTALALKSTSIALAFLVLARGSGSDAEAAAGAPSTPVAAIQWILLGIFGLCALVFSVRLLSHRRYDWPAIARDLMPLEMASRLLVPLSLANRIGWVAVAALFFVPAFWYVTMARLVHLRGFRLPKRF